MSKPSMARNADYRMAAHPARSAPPRPCPVLDALWRRSSTATTPVPVIKTTDLTPVLSAATPAPKTAAAVATAKSP